MVTDAVKLKLFYSFCWQSRQDVQNLELPQCETKTWINHLYQDWVQSKTTNRTASWINAITQKSEGVFRIAYAPKKSCVLLLGELSSINRSGIILRSISV